MSIRKFIGSSASLLLAWLGITYFNDVPAENYPTQGRPSRLTSTVLTPGEQSVATLDLPEIKR